MSAPVAILAGGFATRLGSLTTHLPKILIDVAGRPFAEHQIELLKRKGVSRVVFCVGYLGQQVVDALGDGGRWGMTFTYSFDGPVALGTGGAILRALPLLGGPFFVMYGDSYLDCDFQAIESTFFASGKMGLMTVCRNDDRWDRSNVLFSGGSIVRYDKSHRDALMRHIDYGLGMLTPAAMAPWAGHEGTLDLVTVYQHLVETGTLAGYEVAGRFYEIGSTQGIEDTRALLEAGLRSRA